LETLSGASGGTDLGTFTGATIPDNSNVKVALQFLETSLETQTDDQTAGEVSFDPTGLTTVTTNSVQEAIEELDGGIPSDRRLKENIKLLQNTLDKLNKLNGYSYNYISDKEKNSQMGVIAQELEKVYPQLVQIDKSGFKRVRYEGLIPVLLEAVKEQQDLILSLEEKVASQERKLSAIEQDNKMMKADVALIKRMLNDKSDDSSASEDD
ncbi:MAG: tail fiber domain-containing protein, partial [Bacteroidota bacterium]